MKVVILAGGLGSRLSEETGDRPKPLVEVGGRPIIWHIMKIYSAYGFHDFIICCGYKGYSIKEYFANYAMHNSDLTVDLHSGSIQVLRPPRERWNVTLVDTGERTMTGGRLKRIIDYLPENEDFCFTYGDGVGNIDINALVRFHKKHQLLATMSVVRPPGRFGVVSLNGDRVASFTEKPFELESYINGGFFVLNRSVIQYIESDDTTWEREPLSRLAAEKNLAAFRHDGFWQCMDTVRDRNYLDGLWQAGAAPWKIWE